MTPTAPPPRAVVPVWRRPWVVLVVLPDEPHRFHASDGPEAFPGLPCVLVSGRHLTWYGPSLAEAPEVLANQFSY